MKTVIFLNSNGVDKGVLRELESMLNKENIEYKFYENELDLKDMSFAIALGGDGTILHAAKLCATYDKGVLGINCGHLGYNADLECDELELLKKLKTGEFNTDKRMMLEVSVEKNGTTSKKFYCINDAVISRGTLSRIIDLSVAVGEHSIMSVRSDGIIVSTPTGSTAYSLSAGGPILDPSINSILVTSICPHSFFSRPVVINENETVKIKVASKTDSDFFLTLDGEENVELNESDTVIIKKAQNTSARIIRIKDRSFMAILNKKFNS